MDTSPLVIVGAGPIGLTAAAHARARGLRTLVLEAGPTAAAAVRQWGHVRLFSAWSELVDPVARDLLSTSDGGWSAPDPTTYPTGEEWASRYLLPLAQALDATDEVEVRLGCRVVGVTRQGRDRLVDSGRADTPFELRVAVGDRWKRVLASAVVDASGTWGLPSPLGSDGLPAYGEAEHADRITYGIPDLSAPDVAERYAGRHVAVAGSGASAQNVLVALTGLAPRGTTVSWLVRRGETADAFGGGDNDQLEARGALGKAAEAAVRTGPVRAVTRFRAAEIGDDPARPGALRITSTDGATVDGVDEVVVVTGFRPDLDWLGEVRLDLDPVLSAPTRLAPLIDPNVHSCGTVYPHGAAELAQPEPGLYLAGMKSYGRARSFLALTGFEQVRSIVAALAGDHEAAARVELVLPETGVCGGSGQFDTPAEDTGCCAAPAGDLLTIGPPAG